MKKSDDKREDKIETEVEELKTEVEDLKNKYLRSLADYQNLERQTQNWREEFVKYAGQNLIVQLLDVIDDLEKARDHLNDPGLKIILDKFLSVLKNSGLEEVAVAGSEFDPNLAEVIEVVPGEEDHKVVEVLRKGYKLNGRVIRPARVKVSKKS